MQSCSITRNLNSPYREPTKLPRSPDNGTHARTQCRRGPMTGLWKFAARVKLLEREKEFLPNYALEKHDIAFAETCTSPCDGDDDVVKSRVFSHLFTRLPPPFPELISKENIDEISAHARCTRARARKARENLANEPTERNRAFLELFSE